MKPGELIVVRAQYKHDEIGWYWSATKRETNNTALRFVAFLCLSGFRARERAATHVITDKGDLYITDDAEVRSP